MTRNQYSRRNHLVCLLRHTHKLGRLAAMLGVSDSTMSTDLRALERRGATVRRGTGRAYTTWHLAAEYEELVNRAHMSAHGQIYV